MRAREPDSEGYVDRDGVKLHREVLGAGEPTLLLLPAWTIVHARFWKAQVPYLARHFRVVSYDGPGNGSSDRPLDPAPYGCEPEGRSALVVHGDDDRICPVPSGAALARATGGNLAVIEGAGHLPNARDPVRVNRLVREYAASLAAGGGG
jgi:pimeloyl-ACP methyl ester carboxylesterase